MYYDPLPHQVEDSDLMLEYEVAYLWADAGTGKTITAMEAIRKGGFEKVIVVCPTMAVTMWKEELEKHLQDHSRVGNKKYFAKALRRGTLGRGEGVYHADAIVTSFGVARQLRKGRFSNLFTMFQIGKRHCAHPEARAWNDRYKTVMIIDEAHGIKSREAKITLGLLGPAYDMSHPTCMAYGVNALWQLTGTPVTRYYDDLWTQLRAGRAELLRYYKAYHYDDFVRMFCRTKYLQRGRGPKRKVVAGNTNASTLNRLLEQAAVIRRKLEDVTADLPPITHRIVDTDYKNVREGGIGKMTPEQLMAALADEKSEASTIRRQLGTAKVNSVLEYVKEYGQLPFLIGFWHKEMGAEMFEQLTADGYNVAIVDGATPTMRRDLIREDFNAGKIDGIIGQMQAMNTSWNLQEMCRHVIIAEELPSPALLHQFYSRVYRRGQKNHVQVDHMLSTHSLDVALRNIRLTKAADNEKVDL